MLYTTGRNNTSAFLLVLAGVATSPDFMERIRVELHRRVETEGGGCVRSAAFHPYGDWSRGLFRQLREARRDLAARPGQAQAPLGGARVLEAIDGSYEGGPIVILGHSGGGVAGVLAAELLMRRGISAEQIAVVQIGSPKCRIPPDLAARTGYFYAVNQRGKSIDPICRLGSWTGWERGRYGLLRLNRRMHAPAHIQGVPISGGHADYFRDRAPYVDMNGRSNLNIVADAVWNWLTR